MIFLIPHTIHFRQPQQWDRLLSKHGCTFNKQVTYILTEWAKSSFGSQEGSEGSVAWSFRAQPGPGSRKPSSTQISLPHSRLATLGSDREWCPTCSGALLTIPSLRCAPSAHSLLPQSLSREFWSLGSNNPLFITGTAPCFKICRNLSKI